MCSYQGFIFSVQHCDNIHFHEGFSNYFLNDSDLISSFTVRSTNEVLLIINASSKVLLIFPSMYRVGPIDNKRIQVIL